jgi:hypothetical protein
MESPSFSLPTNKKNSWKLTRLNSSNRSRSKGRVEVANDSL